jgi:hypothetical protein
VFVCHGDNLGRYTSGLADSPATQVADGKREVTLLQGSRFIKGEGLSALLRIIKLSQSRVNEWHAVKSCSKAYWLKGE